MSGEQTELTGLTSAEVRDRIERDLVNRLPSRSGRSTADIVRANVFTRVNLILFVLFCCVLVTGHLLQGAFGLLIIANSVIGIVQELRAKRTLDNLAVVGEAHPTVIREGRKHQIVRDAVVLDDLIAIHPGEQIVVDGSVVAADYLEVDESLLTGEADPVTKAAGDGVLSGSYVLSGTGVYRAEKVGSDAYAAQLTAQAAKFTLVSSELRQGIDRILRVVGYLLIPVGLLNIYVQFSQPDTDWRTSVLRATAALVPMVPEGLVLLTSMAFALGVIRLGRRNCLVQELPAIEGLARVSVVCADKTGTLTQHAMTLGKIVPLGVPRGRIDEVLSQLVAADPAPNASMRAIGDHAPTPVEPWEVRARAPFTSAKKWSGATFAREGSWLIGAADILADADVAAKAERIGATGRRVLLLATTHAAVDDPGAPGPITPAALLVLDQVQRPDAAETLAYFQEQQVAVKVISGDNAASVGAVTRALGVPIGDVVDARTLPEGEAFVDAVNDGDVFGRVTPEQKRAMVDALQERGHHVAMTGDGVNDVLALKDADLGVAMGSGAAATRAVAQIVLLDDKFATLPHVVAEGRRVIGNIERVAKLFLTKTTYAVVLALAVGLLHLPNPFLPLQMTIVGWFTIGIPAFLMSLAPNRERARPGFVARTLAVAVPGGLIVAVAALTTYLVTRGGLADIPHDVHVRASTSTLIALIMSATWVLSVVARPYVWWRLALVAFAYGFYFLIFAVPAFRRPLTLDISDPATVTFGVVAGLAAAAAVEATWWITARIRGERPMVWENRRADGLTRPPSPTVHGVA